MGIETMVAMTAGRAIIDSNRESRRSKAQNKAITKYNEKLQYETMQTVNQMNLQRAQIIQAQQDALFNIGVVAQAQQGAVQLQAAATDTVGASVSDAIGAVNTAASLDRGEVQNQFTNTVTAWEMQKQGVLRQGSYNLQEPDKNRAGDILLDGVLNIGGMLAMNAVASSMNNDMENTYSANTTQSIGTSTDFYGTTGNVFTSLKAAVPDAYTNILSGKYHNFSSTINSSLALSSWAKRYS